jgi:hypothetical protein
MTNTLSSDVVVQRPWGVKRVPGSVPQNQEEICVRHIGHTWGKSPGLPGDPIRYFVQDFLIDQSGLSGPQVAKLAETVQFDLTLKTNYKYLVGPAVCRGGGGSVKVTIPQNTVGKVYFSAYLGRMVTTGATGGSFMGGTGTVTWLQAGTSTPTISYNGFGITQGNNEALIFDVEGEVSEEFQFGALIMEGEYPARSFDPGQKSYRPLSYADPSGIGPLPASMGTTSETFVMFGYNYEPSTANPTDPGPFVSIV